VIVKKPISPTMHGVIDYATVATTAAVPRLLRFPRQAEQLCYALAGGYGGLSSVTNYPLSVKRAVPFKVHGAAEAAVGLALPFMPWMLGFAKHRAARNFFLGLTALTALTAALTDWSAED
jgi:hypothetical protein